MPFRVTDEQALQYVLVLKAAGLVEAIIVACAESGDDEAADILAITSKGRVALAQHAQGRPLL
jgi:hypothetical protein